MAARGSAKGQQYALGDVTRDGSIAPTNEPARAGGEHASRSAHFDEVDARSSVTVEASDPEHGRSSNLQLEKGTPDDLRSLPAARQRAAGAHDRRHDRARLQRATRSGYVRHVRAFAAFIGRSPDTATAEDLRLFQLHQRAGGTCKGKEQRQVWTRKSLRCPTRGLGQVGKSGLGRGATTLMPRAGCYPG